MFGLAVAAGVRAGAAADAPMARRKLLRFRIGIVFECITKSAKGDEPGLLAVHQRFPHRRLAHRQHPRQLPVPPIAGRDQIYPGKSPPDHAGATAWSGSTITLEAKPKHPGRIRQISLPVPPERNAELRALVDELLGSGWRVVYEPARPCATMGQMLTRLRVSGFKNLVDADVSFGPFTCIAGANGVGKSNLLDAIHFLSSLADKNFQDAAMSVRDCGALNGDFRDLFQHMGEGYINDMEFVAEMIIPSHGTDDLGQPVTATCTFVRYTLGFRHRRPGLDSLELVTEELEPIASEEAPPHLPFKPSRQWLGSVLGNSGPPAKYLSTTGLQPRRGVNVFEDGGPRNGQLRREIAASSLPRTVLSVAESTTLALVRKEMRSWRVLNLQPSALREPDHFGAPIELGRDGAHMPSVLFHAASAADPDAMYAQMRNRLAELVGGIRAISVDRDEARQLLTLYATASDGTSHSARVLSDGTLRFLAMAALSFESSPGRLVCIEEPENGIHPERIPAVIQLLRDLAVEIDDAVGTDNPLRQLIITTHSPGFVEQVPEDSLVVAVTMAVTRTNGTLIAPRFCGLPGTWRGQTGSRSLAKGLLLGYLNPVARSEDGESDSHRVIDREDLKRLKFGAPEIAP